MKCTLHFALESNYGDSMPVEFLAHFSDTNAGLMYKISQGGDSTQNVNSKGSHFPVELTCGMVTTNAQAAV